MAQRQHVAIFSPLFFLLILQLTLKERESGTNGGYASLLMRKTTKRRTRSRSRLCPCQMMTTTLPHYCFCYLSSAIQIPRHVAASAPAPLPSAASASSAAASRRAAVASLPVCSPASPPFPGAPGVAAVLRLLFQRRCAGVAAAAPPAPRRCG